jgi:hypothetical protein
MNALQLANDLRAACLHAAVAAYEDAGIQGLCHEGRWEAAIGAMQMVDLRGLIQEFEHVGPGSARDVGGKPGGID